MTQSTLDLYDLLKRAGWEEAQAREGAKLLLTVGDKEQLATKADLAELRAEMRVGFATLRREIGDDFHAAMWTHLRWLIGLQVVALGAMGGVFAGVVKWVLQP